MSTLIRRLAAIAAALIGCALVLVAAYVGWIVLATRLGVAATRGTITNLPLDSTVTIARDGRGIPHIRAQTDHDLFFAEGFAMASDRLFQMEVTRRYVLGRLAEMLGSPLLAVDRRMRSYGIAPLADATYRVESPEARAALGAFVDGVNAAADSQPIPPEFRALFFRPERWTPRDVLAVGFATVLELDDEASWIFARDWIHRRLGQAGTDAFLPLTDPKYDVPVNGDAAGVIPPLPTLPGATPLPDVEHIEERTPQGSNAWAAGADRTTNGRAVLANDPHLSLGVPGRWWLVEMESPHYHLAGATVVGTPGVTLGHNDHVAWGVTAAETAAMRLIDEPARGSDEFFEGGHWIHALHRHEHYVVRFGHSVDEDVLETPLGTVISHAPGGTSAYVRDWRLARHPQSPLDAFLGLDRARSVDDGLAALRGLPDPALNAVLVDDAGRVTFHLVGGVPVDEAAARWAVDGDTPEPPLLPFDRAPQIAPSRDALVVTANNRDDGAGGPRLAPFWQAPYRAYEIRRALNTAANAQHQLSPDAVAGVLHDLSSPAELEFARLVVAAAIRRHVDTDPALAANIAALRDFDGNVTPGSRGATVVAALRIDMLNALAQMHMPRDVALAYVGQSSSLVVPLRALREMPRGWVPADDWDGFVVQSLRRVRATLGETPPPFGTYGALPLLHPLAPFGFRLWNGPTLTGAGGRYAPAVQWDGHGQLFRALWIAGDWDAGTIDIDAGESGEPGSPHYDDQTDPWERGARSTLPFSDAAVAAATKTLLTLTH
ncbi:MAG TPA: penicillin acylase family protein [Candidatus Acidoferrum sp.]|nr:penicillin acylase family protein [Candidatus Acidoferrum sp.]